MRRCKITIELDRDDASYSLTEPVTGQVVVDVRRTTQCDELELSCMLKTHGRGDRYKKEFAEINLFSGEWQPGQYSYPFSIPVESHQDSYHGQHINIDWYLRAEADIPKSLDVKEEIDFLRVNDHEELFIGDEYQIASNILDEEKSGRKIGLFITVLLVPFLFLIPLLGSNNVPGFLQPLADILASNEIILSDIFEHFDKAFGLIFAAVFGMIVLSGIKHLAQKKSDKMLGHPKIEIEGNKEVQPGERLHCLLAFTPNQSSRVKHCSATLHGYEHAVDTSGTTDSTFKHTLYEQSIDLPFYNGITTDVPVEKTFELQIPPGAPMSFDLGKNDLIWAIEIELQLGKWLKWEGKRQIKVLPQSR